MFGFKRRKAPAVSEPFPLITNQDFFADVVDNCIIITFKGNYSIFDGDRIMLDVTIDSPKLVNGRLYGESKEFKESDGT